MHSLWLGYFTTPSVLVTYSVLGQQCLASAVERKTLFQQYTLSVFLFIEQNHSLHYTLKALIPKTLYITNAEQDKKPNQSTANKSKEIPAQELKPIQ